MRKTLINIRYILSNKKIIAFSLWGEKPVYNVGAIRNAELAKEIYPDWICRYYLGKSVPFQTIQEFTKL